MAATLESTLLDVEGLGDAAGPAYAVLDEVADPGAARLRRISARDTGFRRVLQGVDTCQRDRRAEHRQPAHLTQADRVDLRPARHPVGAGVEPVTGNAPRLVRHRIGVRAVDLRRARKAKPTGWKCCTTCMSGGRSSARVLSNMAQVLAKSDLGLAAHYAELVADEILATQGVRQDRRRAPADDRHAQTDHRVKTTYSPTIRRWRARCSTGFRTWSR